MMERPDAVPRLVALLDPDLQAVLDDLAPLIYTADQSTRPDDIPKHVRAASAIRRSGRRLVIVQDDVNVLTFHHDGGHTEAVLLPAGEGGRRTFGSRGGNKHAKMDLEACATLPDGRLVAFGSGSTSRREQVVVVGPGAPRVVDARELYGVLRADPAFAGSELNVEGSVVVGDVLRFFQRGNGAANGEGLPVDATGDLPLHHFIRWLDGGASLPPVQNVVQYDLGSIAGVPYTYTDAALTADGPIVYLACAEASPDTYGDGQVLGCRVGIIEGQVVRTADVRHTDGSLADLKLEGLEPRPGEPWTFDVVADVDRPEEPALRGRLVVRRKGAPGGGGTAGRPVLLRM